MRLPCDTPQTLAVKRDQLGGDVTEVSGVPADAQLIDGLTLIASRAAAAILAISPSGLAWQEKRDHSPSTAADLASESVILEGLRRLLPGVPVVSEETAGQSSSGAPERRFVLVDPLDGTRELLAGRDEFTVNIALISGNQPIVGIVAAPARGLMWRGIVGIGAERIALAPGALPNSARDRIAIHTRAQPATGLVALVSRSHLDPATETYLARMNPTAKIACGSSLKFCQIAEGMGDLYPRLAPTSEWDVAAGHAVLAAAGGFVTAPNGDPLTYGRNSNYRIPAFIARGDRDLAIAL